MPPAETPSVVDLRAAAAAFNNRWQAQRHPELEGAVLDLDTIAPEVVQAALQMVGRGAKKQIPDVIFDDAWSEHASELMRLILLRENDVRLRDVATVDGLQIARLDLASSSGRLEGLGVSVPAMDAVIGGTADGAPYLRPASPDERVIAIYLADNQVAVPTQQPGRPSHDPAATALRGEAANHVSEGRAQRACWGAGTFTLTNRRAMGLVFDNPSDYPEPPWPAAVFYELVQMPRSEISRGHNAEIVGTMLGFSIDRALFSRSEVPSGGFFQSRLTYFQLVGKAPLALGVSVVRTVDPSSRREARPPKGSVSRAVEAFMQ